MEAPEEFARLCRAEWPRLVGALTLWTGDRGLAEELAKRRSFACASVGSAYDLNQRGHDCHPRSGHHVDLRRHALQNLKRGQIGQQGLAAVALTSL